MTPDKPPPLPGLLPDGEGRPERWRPVPEYRLLGIPPGYEASSEGRVLGVRGTVLAQQEDRDGYLTVKVGRRRVGVHVLVALAFKGPPQVRHLGDRRDNRPAKLEWGSKWRNERDKKEKREREGEKERGAGGVESCYCLFPAAACPVTPVTGGAG